MRRASRHQTSEVGSRIAGVGLALLFSSLVGCDSGLSDGYDPELRYPLRSDPLVLQPPPDVPVSPAPPGRLNEWIAGLSERRGKLADPHELVNSPRLELQKALEELFGTPSAPLVAVPGRPTELPGVDLSAVHLAEGSRHYRRLCAQCHGLTGDGRGPAGAWVYPHPRDFRQGVFKTAIGTSKPPSEALTRILRVGVPGSSMPLFDLIPDEDVR